MASYSITKHEITQALISDQMVPSGITTLAPRLNHQAARNIHYMVYELGGYSPKEWQSDT